MPVTQKARNRAREAFRLHGAQSADYLHRRVFADPLENGADRVAKNVTLNELGVGAPRVGLQVNADRIHAGLKHTERGIRGLRG